MRAVIAVLAALALGAQGFNFCKPCCKLASFIETEITREEPEEDKVLDAACYDLVHSDSGFLKKLCDTVVKEGLKVAVHFLDTKQPPSKVCHEAKLCDGSNDCASFLEEAPVVEAVSKAQLCALDQAAMKAISSGQVDALCRQYAPLLHLPASICSQISANEKMAENYLQHIYNAVCKSSQDQLVNEAFDPAAVKKDICSLDAQAIAFIDSGDLAKLCDYISHFIPNLPKGTCKALLQNKALVKSVLGRIQSALHCSSSSAALPDFAGFNACQAVTEFIQLLQEVEQFVPQAKQIVDEIMPYLEMLKNAACHSSVSHMTLGEHASAMNNQICQVVNEFSTAFDMYWPTVCDLIKEKDPSLDCDAIKSKIDDALNFVKHLASC